MTSVDTVENRDKEVEDHLTSLGLTDHYILKTSADHIGADTLLNMKRVHVVRQPGDTFMQENLPNAAGEFTIPPISKELLQGLKNIPAESNDVIINGFNTITALANKQKEDITAADRKLYRVTVGEIMDIVMGMHKKSRNVTAERTLHGIPLNGGLIFEDQVQRHNLATKSLKIQAKRLDLAAQEDNGVKEGFMAIATGAHVLSEGLNMEEIDSFICVDDCLSTALTQLAMLEEALAAGCRPKEVSILVTVTTTGGAKYLYEQIELLKQKYNIDFQFNFNFAAICTRVNNQMYLQRPDGNLFYVGDMGWWLAHIPEIDGEKEVEIQVEQ